MVEPPGPAGGALIVRVGAGDGNSQEERTGMAGLGWQELVIVLVIIMIIFGAGKLPEIAKSLGQGVKEFREEASAPVAPVKTTTEPAAKVEATTRDAI